MAIFYGNVQLSFLKTSSSTKSSSENLHSKLRPDFYESDDNDVERTMMSSPLSWEDECNLSSNSSVGLTPYEDLSSGGVQWHRLSGDSWEEQHAMQWPHLSDSVVSVPSSFHFTQKTVDIDYGERPTSNTNDLADGLPLRRSVSEGYISHYSQLSPPPKNFYHLVPTPLATKNHRTILDSPFSPIRKKSPTWSEKKVSGHDYTLYRQEKKTVCRKRSLSLPSLADAPANLQLFSEDGPERDLFTGVLSGSR